MSREAGRPRKVIVAPLTNGKRAGVRAIIEAVAGFDPVTGALARLYQTTHPPKAEQEREDWQNTITERSNEHDKRLDRLEATLSPKAMEFSGLAARMIQAIGRSCPDGLAEHFVDLLEVKEMLPDATEEEIVETAEEFATYGLLTVRNLIGAWRVRPTQLFYEQFDHQIMGWGSSGTRWDAAFVAQLMLEKPEAQSQDLHELTGWPLRRFNPALANLKHEYPDWCWRDRYHSDFPSLGLVIGPREKAGLRKVTTAAEQEAATSTTNRE